ncbi:MAG: hypothetical protein OXT72_05600 [Gammaproteobacteria bacterium]|nr:hypothetical protein [Gammaproteobacteria bacterium]MDE0247978.1 hypothetical protein [Gammaproteobacteria bacterium]
MLTALPEATRLLEWYALHWRIEDNFWIFKSGCRIEDLQHQTAERLQRAIA